MPRRIILTLDYELFFLNSGTPEKSILRPTKTLLDFLKEQGISATFFVDTTYLNKLNSSSDSYDQCIFEQIKRQLQEIISSGSRIELHLHPHWIDAIKDGQRWEFPSYQHYKLNSLSKTEIEKLFSEGVSILHNIAWGVDPNYRITSFRAGGWCVDPFLDIKTILKDNHIFIDSSACPGLFLSGDVHSVDYRDLSASPFYRFTNSIREPNEKGEFLEVPVNGFTYSAFERSLWLLKSRVFRRKARIWGDGVGMPSIKNMSKMSKVISILKNERYFSQYTLDGYVDKKLLYNKILDSELPIISIVAHPKTLTSSSLDALSYLKDKGCVFFTLKSIGDEIV